MQAADGLRKTAYAIVMILLLLGLFFLLIRDFRTAGMFAGVGAALVVAIEWLRARTFRSFARSGVSAPRQ